MNQLTNSRMRSMGLRVIAGLAVLALAQNALNAQVVISQVYGGGGNSGAPLRSDFIELHNTGSSPVDITGWSVQYGSAGDTNGGLGSGNPAANVPTVLSGIIPAGGFYLVKEADGANLAAPALPTPDATGNIAMGSGTGRVALVNNSTAILTNCAAATIVDFVGYGSGTVCSETAVAPAPSNTLSIIRQNNGCQDNNNNSLDFLTTGTITPRNSSSPTVSCSGTAPTGTGNPSTPDPVCTGSNVTLSVTVTPGTSPTSTGITVTVNATTIGGSASQGMFDDGPGGGHGDAVAGDGVYTIQIPVALATTIPNPNAPKVMTVSIQDAQLRSSVTSVQVTVDRCFPSANGIASPVALCTSGGDVDILVFVNPASTGNTNIQSVVANLSSIGGSATQTLYDDATNGDRLGGDNTWTFRYTAPAGLSLGAHNIPFLATDADARTAAGAATLNTITCTTASSTVVISQLFGGGGNSGAPFANDFIELFNRSAAPVDIGGWSVQYSAAVGAFSQTAPLPASPVIIPPGGYYLIQAQGGVNGFPLPTPDATTTVINMSGTDGKVALVNNTTSLGANCSAASIMDLVGYGTTANCHEGSYYAPSGSNTYAMFRLHDGCQDTDQNAPDFFPFPPAPRNSSTAPNPCPVASCTCRGDVNGDTVVNAQDIQGFVNCLTAGGSCTCADVNNDTASDSGDILPMVNALLAGACAP